MCSLGFASLLILASQPCMVLQAKPDYANLLHWRYQFETVLRPPSWQEGYTQVGSEMLGGAHGDALYPLGSAAERYILSFDEADSGGEVVYEKRYKGHTLVVWHLPFVPYKKKPRVQGTVRLYLRKLGFVIDGKRSTERISRQLSASGYFASYSYHPMNGGIAYVVKPNGETTRECKSDDVFTITFEERQILERGPGSMRN